MRKFCVDLEKSVYLVPEELIDNFNVLVQNIKISKEYSQEKNESEEIFKNKFSKYELKEKDNSGIPHYDDLPSEESLIEQAWKEFCERKHWFSAIENGYTVKFKAFDMNTGNFVYGEFMGE
jgi:hypothetical protein